MALALPLTLAACATATGPQGQAATDTAAGVAALEAMLARHPSATQALQAICDAKHKGAAPRIVARKYHGRPIPPLEDVRQLLRLEPGEEAAYRHVALICGDETLSVAHNWYVPSRLTPEMNETLANTETPFGRVVAPLGFKREETKADFEPALECPGNTVSVHRALLRLPDRTPLAFIVECYTPASTQWSLAES